MLSTTGIGPHRKSTEELKVKSFVVIAPYQSPTPLLLSSCHGTTCKKKTHTHTHTHTQIDRQTDRQTDRHSSTNGQTSQKNTIKYITWILMRSTLNQFTHQLDVPSRHRCGVVKFLGEFDRNSHFISAHVRIWRYH